MSITNLEKVTFGVDDMDLSIRFWTDFGLARAETEHPLFRAQDGSSVELRAIDDPTLPPATEPGSTLREATFGVASQEELDTLAAELARDRDVTEDDAGTIHSTDPFGNALALRVARRTPVAAPELRFNTPGHPDRINTRGQFHKSVHPIEMTHTVYMVDDTGPIVSFYTERLGFKISDCYPDRGYFLRGGASRHHHDLFLLNAGGKRGYHHVAFELGSIHELFGGGLNMTRSGWETALGPGRHPISSCYFWYFKCPSGGAAEYDFDSDQVDDDWVPGTFEQTPENFAEWCLAEGMQDTLLFKGIQSARTAEK